MKGALVLLVAIVGVLERVPLCDRPTRGGQHVRPVAKLRARRVVAEHRLADGLRGTDAIVVNNSHDQLHFL